MKNQSWNFTDKSNWPSDEWKDEPDKIQWTDSATELPCLVVRGPSGALCGYVGVSEAHSYFQKDYNDCDVDVHGGLTFASLCSHHGEDLEQGVCHVVEEGDNDRVWWLGFDCGHCGDVMPRFDSAVHSEEYASYKTVAYVQQECASLAAQLVEVK